MVVVATHDSRILPLADRVVELVPDFAESNRPPSTVQLEAGDVLFEEGTMGDCIYVVSEGEVEIVRELAGGGEQLLWVAETADSSASSARCSTCHVRRRRGRAPMRSSSDTPSRRFGSASASAASAI